MVRIYDWKSTKRQKDNLFFDFKVTYIFYFLKYDILIFMISFEFFSLKFCLFCLNLYIYIILSVKTKDKKKVMVIESFIFLDKISPFFDC